MIVARPNRENIRRRREIGTQRPPHDEHRSTGDKDEQGNVALRCHLGWTAVAGYGKHYRTGCRKKQPLPHFNRTLRSEEATGISRHRGLRAEDSIHGRPWQPGRSGHCGLRRTLSVHPFDHPYLLVSHFWQTEMRSLRNSRSFAWPAMDRIGPSTLHREKERRSDAGMIEERTSEGAPAGSQSRIAPPGSVT